MDPAAEFLKINISSVLTTNFNQFQQFLLFFQSIEWTEPWLIALCCFHLLLTLLTLITRKKPTFQAILFLFLLILIFLSEQLNIVAAENWQLYSKHQYFDQDGMFISLMFSCPLLFNCLLMVANWLMISSEMMTSLRRFQLQHQNSRRPTAANPPPSSSSSSTSGGVRGKKRDRVKKD